jgi:transposase
MFVRVKSTPNSPRRSVQVVESVRTTRGVSQRIVRHMGIALDAQEEQQLRAMAQEFIAHETAARLNQGALFETPPLRPPGRPARQTLASVAGVDQVQLADLREVARRVEGPHEVLGHLWDYLGFDRVLPGRGAALLRDLVLSRIMAPASKRASAHQLELHYGRSYELDQLYRMMDALHERLDALQAIVLQATASLTAGAVQMMLFDVTTLYFESVDADGLRAFGYSKDQKYHCTQVVLALATNEDGLPIGYELFAGNTAEVKTLLACMQRWMATLPCDKVRFVADRALCSRANLDLLDAQNVRLAQAGAATPGAAEETLAQEAVAEEAVAEDNPAEPPPPPPWTYVVAMPLRRSLKEAQQAQVLTSALARPLCVEGDLLWVREFEWEGRRLIVSYSSRRAHKDQADRQALIDKLQAKLGKSLRVDPKTGEIKCTANAKRLISNRGYLRYVEQADTGGAFVVDEERIAQDATWDGLHAVVTNDRSATAAQLLAHYRRLWMIEESFRTLKTGLAVRPIYHFKSERIAAHIGLCYLAFSLVRHAQQRIKLAQEAMSVERIREALHGVQASILEHNKTGARYRLPSAFGHDAARIYKAFGLKRQLEPAVDLS